MDPRDDEPFDREPWRALLGNDAPPREVDQRVLAAARRAHRPRLARWYLPASLVASVLLAVLLVQWQLDESRSPAVVSEFDVQPAPPPARAAKEPPAAAGPIGALQRQAPDAASTAPAPASPESESRPLADTAAPSAPPPQESARARREAARPETSADATAAAAPAPAAAARELGKLEVLKESSTERTPEEWYAEIEALRAAGRIDEAETELARLEAAHPGWLAARESKKQ